MEDKDQIIDEVMKDNPNVPRYFCEILYRFCKNNPELASAVERGEVDFPMMERQEGLTDEQKLEKQKEYQSKVKILLDKYKTS